MKLKVGDKIFIKQYSSLIGFETILKTTKTMAKSRNYAFDLEISDNGYCRIKGLSKWNTSSGLLANEKLESEWKLKKIKNWYYENKNKFTDEQIKKIYNLFSKK